MASSGDYKRIQEHEIQDFAKSQIGFAVNVLEDVYQGLNKLFPGLMGKFPELSVLLDCRQSIANDLRSFMKMMATNKLKVLDMMLILSYLCLQTRKTCSLMSITDILAHVFLFIANAR